MIPARHELEIRWFAEWSGAQSSELLNGMPASIRLDLVLAPFIGSIASDAIASGDDPLTAAAAAMGAVRHSCTHQEWEVDASAARISAKHRAEAAPMRARQGGDASILFRYWLAGSAVWLAAFGFWYYLVGQHEYWRDTEPVLVALAPPALVGFACRAWKWAARR